MTNFTVHTQESAPVESRPLLQKLQSAIGFVPGLYGVLAEAPVAAAAYDSLATMFKDTSLTTNEQHVVLLTINYENNCAYCMPAHTGLAKMDKVPDDVIEAIRNGTAIADPKLQALRVFTAQVVNTRGWVGDADVQAFLNAGFTQQQILEVIVGMSYKVISNYTNHLADTPIDAAFQKFTWEKPSIGEAA